MTVNFHLLSHFVRHFFTAHRKGHGVHSPFAYRLCEDVFYNQAGYYVFNELEVIRKQLLANNTELEVTDFGAGSKVFKTNQRKIKDIAASGISSRRQSELLYRLINYLNCKTCIELGTSLGLNTLYLASVNSDVNVFSIEGSSKLQQFASQLAKSRGSKNIEFINGRFEHTLPVLLSQIDTLDFFYVDGNHTYEATLNYFNQALPYVNNNSVFVFDDIYWSQGMTKAWQEISEHHNVTLSLDLFYFGLVFFRKEIKEKTNLAIYI